MNLIQAKIRRYNLIKMTKSWIENQLKSSQRMSRLKDVVARVADAVGRQALPEVGEVELAEACRKRAWTRCFPKFRKTMHDNSVSTKPHSYLRHLWASLRKQLPLMKANSPKGVPMELIDKHKQTQKLLKKKIRTMRGKDQPRMRRKKRKRSLYLRSKKKKRKRGCRELITTKITLEECRHLIYEFSPKTRQRSSDKYKTLENFRISSTIKHSLIETLMM